MFGDIFDQFCALLVGRVPAGVVLFANWRAEHSDFVRFNQGRLRQAGSVLRIEAELKLVQGRRVTHCFLNLTGRADDDRQRLDSAFTWLLSELADAPEDPHLLINPQPSTSDDRGHEKSANPDEVVHCVQQQARGHDLVGHYMSGPMAQGHWSSNGGRHFFERSIWSLDYSVYARSSDGVDRRDKAVKANVSAQRWQPQLIADSISASLAKYDVLHRPPRVLAPGSYRALLSPAAAAELLSMMTWGGFSMRAERTGQSPLSRLRRGEAHFSRQLQLSEDLLRFPAPRFQNEGFLRPAATQLVRDGGPGDLYCSPRTAQEFGVQSTGAGEYEGPLVMNMAPGGLEERDALTALDTGIDISNLWYLNFSDRRNAQVTGMTRFATFWVENGQWVAPIVPMRFDDSLYNLFGSQLQALGAQAHWLPELASYDWRSASGMSVPLALVQAMRFTL